MPNLIAYFNELEYGACIRVNRLSRRAWVRNFFALVSKLGDYGIWLMMGALIFAIQGPASLPSIATMAVIAAVGILFYKLLKQRLVRERPYINHGNITCEVPPLDRYSFPSGHTLHAASFAVMLPYVEPALAPFVVPFALLVAASRVILGLHYPSDVIVGAMIGAALGNLGITLMQ
jgi:undecaprenyl-diphosphatase